MRDTFYLLLYIGLHFLISVIVFSILYRTKNKKTKKICMVIIGVFAPIALLFIPLKRFK